MGVYSDKTRLLRFITLVAPFEQEVPDVRIRLLEGTEVGSTHYKFEVEHRGKKKQLSYKL